MSEEEKRLGIENFKEVLNTFLSVGILGYNSFIDDKRIDTSEGISLAFKIPALWSAVKKIDDAIPEAKDLDPDELRELMNLIIEKLKEVNKKED